MSEILLFDESCRYMGKDIKTIVRELEKAGVTYIKNPTAEFLQADICIYIIKGIDVGIAERCRFIKKAANVHKWIILALCLETQTQRNITLFERDFSNSLDGIDKIIGVAYSNNCIKKLIEMRSLMNHKSEIELLIVSRKDGVGRNSIANLLLTDGTHVNTIIGGLSEYFTYSQSANMIIIVGTCASDFLSFEPPKDGFSRVIFLLNKTDESPVSLIHADKIKKSIIDGINFLGWNLQEDSPRFYIISALYEQFNRRLSCGEITENELVIDERFYIWDEFGLPVRKDMYQHEKIKRFLSRFNTAEKISEKLLKGK